MAYEFECTNIIPGCEGAVRGETEEEVLERAASHAAGAHGMDELSEDVVEKVKASIVPAR